MYLCVVCTDAFLPWFCYYPKVDNFNNEGQSLTEHNNIIDTR